MDLEQQNLALKLLYIPSRWNFFKLLFPRPRKPKFNTMLINYIYIFFTLNIQPTNFNIINIYASYQSNRTINTSYSSSYEHM